MTYWTYKQVYDQPHIKGPFYIEAEDGETTVVAEGLSEENAKAIVGQHNALYMQHASIEIEETDGGGFEIGIEVPDTIAIDYQLHSTGIRVWIAPRPVFAEWE